MTIAALLRHHGVSVPRWVTVDGRIVFDDVVTDSVSSNHPIHGAVTPVASHTFHGGEGEPVDISSDMAAWWDETERVNRHLLAMEGSFPTWSYLPASSNLGPSWGGTIDTGRGKFLVAVYTRRDEGLPSVVVLGPRLGVSAGRRWIPSPHLFLSGNLCVADVGDWDPERHTVATVVSWAAHWLAAYTEWRMTRRWPVEGLQSVAA